MCSVWRERAPSQTFPTLEAKSMSVIPDSPLALVVDDEPAMRDLIGEVLEEFGILTVALAEPEAVLEQAAAHRPALIVLDVMMPAMDGYTVAERLRKDSRTAAIPIVFVTGQTEPMYHTMSVDAGAVAHVQKPFTVDTLRAAIGRALAT
jgi:putative two-component system response regulator